MGSKWMKNRSNFSCSSLLSVKKLLLVVVMIILSCNFTCECVIDLETYFFPVPNNGDMNVIVCQNPGSSVPYRLIYVDIGRKESDFLDAHNYVIGDLSDLSNGYDVLVIISHDHDDHYGGTNGVTSLLKFYKGIGINIVGVFSYPVPKNAYTDIYDNLKTKNKKSYFEMCGNVETVVVSKKIGVDPNERSVVFYLEYFDRKVLYTGDLCSISSPLKLDVFDTEYDDSKFDVIKMPHHGSSPELCTRNNKVFGGCFCNRLKPLNSFTISTNDFCNPHGHPDCDSLDNYDTGSKFIMGTDRVVPCYLHQGQNLKIEVPGMVGKYKNVGEIPRNHGSVAMKRTFNSVYSTVYLEGANLRRSIFRFSFAPNPTTPGNAIMIPKRIDGSPIIQKVSSPPNSLVLYRDYQTCIGTYHQAFDGGVWADTNCGVCLEKREGDIIVDLQVAKTPKQKKKLDAARAEEEAKKRNARLSQNKRWSSVLGKRKASKISK